MELHAQSEVNNADKQGANEATTIDPELSLQNVEPCLNNQVFPNNSSTAFVEQIIHNQETREKAQVPN